MLSQIRWMLGVAIGLAVVVAVWLEPEVRDPSGEPARARPAMEPPSAAYSVAPSVLWQQRLEAYWAELDAGARAPGQEEGFQESLLEHHFSLEERPVVRALDAARQR